MDQDVLFLSVICKSVSSVLRGALLGLKVTPGGEEREGPAS